MSREDFNTSIHLNAKDPSLSALIMAACRKADKANLARLRLAFPDDYRELVERTDAPASMLISDACPDCLNHVDDCPAPDAPVNHTCLGPNGSYCLRMLYAPTPIDTA